ncbi:MAG: GAF domain-containing protein [Anaerolineales bacterium]|nr:MAG: GAF domain-containing protein [Anaerolineales bacterium]
MSDDDKLSELERQSKLSQKQAVLYGRDLQRVYQAEKARRETLEAISRRMQAVFDSLTGGLLIIGDDLRIMDANPAFCALIEREVESIVGQPVSAVLPASEMDSLLQEAAGEERSTATGEIELTEPLPRTLLATTSRVQAGESKGWVVILNDMTAWKRMESLNEERIRNLEKRVEELAILNEMSTSLSSTLDLDEVLTLVMERINAVLRVEAGSLLLIDDETGELVFKIALGEKAEGVKPFRLPMGQGIAGHVAQSGQPLMISDAQKDRRHYKAVDVTTDFLTRSMLCVPMIFKGKTIGVIEIMNKLEGDFTESDLTLLNSIATYAAIAIENARLHQSVLAERDRVVVAQEEVQKELARDLHDGPTQLVASMLMRLDFVKKALTRDPSLVEEEIVQLMELGQRASHQMRTLLFELRPLILDTQGLVPALETFLTRRQKEETGTTLHLEVRTERGDDQLTHRDPKNEATLFAIVQEAVRNALKHAQADNIWVRLAEQAGELMVMVQDDGVGFDTAEVENGYEQRGSLGMVNIRERAELVGGHLTLRSTPGQGTEVMIRIPWGPTD